MNTVAGQILNIHETKAWWPVEGAVGGTGGYWDSNPPLAFSFPGCYEVNSV